MLIALSPDLKQTAVTRLLANLLPIAGILLLGWDPITPVWLYWLETLVIGVVALARLWVLNRRDRPNHRDNTPMVGVMVVGYATGALCLYMGVSLLMICSAFHISLADALTVPIEPGFDDFRVSILRDVSVWATLAALAWSQVQSFRIHFLPRTDLHTKAARQELVRPALRIGSSSGVIVLAAMAANALQYYAPIVALTVVPLALIAFKTWLDVGLHIRDKKPQPAD